MCLCVYVCAQTTYLVLNGHTAIDGTLTHSTRLQVDGKAGQSRLSAAWGLAISSALAVVTEADTGAIRTISLDDLMKNYLCRPGEFQSGAACTPCSGVVGNRTKPPGADFVTHGHPYDTDSCGWECPQVDPARICRRAGWPMHHSPAARDTRAP